MITLYISIGGLNQLKNNYICPDPVLIAAQKSKFIRIYSFRRNLGKATALTLAFQKVKGEFVITMDADLQDDLTNLPEMIKAQKEGDYDLISGWLS